MESEARGADGGCGGRGEVGDSSLFFPCFYLLLLLWKHFSAVQQGEG